MLVLAAEHGKFCGRLSPDDVTAPVFAPAFQKAIGSHDPFQNTEEDYYYPESFTVPDKPPNHLDYSTGNFYNTAVYCSKV